jgi:BASS family bile acid:Na+ symporter
MIHFSPNSLVILSVILAFILFGIALELRKEDFEHLLQNKKSAVAALFSHFIILPLITFLVVLLVNPPAPVALGMILVGACPGGNMSNMFTHIAKGNTALAVGVTSISHLLAVVLTPLNFSFYGSLNPATVLLLRDIHLSFTDVLQTISLVIILPLIAGTMFSYKFPATAQKLVPYAKRFSLGAFALFLIAAFFSNRDVIVSNVTSILPIVVLHNAVALLSGFAFAKLLKLSYRDVRTVTFETGVQNSGLALILIFGFFDGMGGMAVVAALWGVWHLVSGGALALYWGKQKN